MSKRYKKRPFHKIHKRMINTITVFATIVFVISLLSVDAEPFTPMITLCLSGVWLTWYAKINNWFYPEN